MKENLPYQAPEATIHTLEAAFPLAESFNETEGSWNSCDDDAISTVEL